jgi:Fe-coproporphyrin III synthase
METCQLEHGAATQVAPFRTIQIHPTKNCNLTCLHCYSYSSPGHKEHLDLESLKNFLSFAFQKGYNNISVSGGEPFLYPHLKELLQFTKQIGFQNSVASNGMLLKSAKNQEILQYIDLIAFSIDGPEALHDHMRNFKGAYRKMLEGVEIVRKRQMAFGFIHTISQESWLHLIDLADFCHAQGASLFQLHPLELFGRATETLANNQLDELLRHKAYILAHYLKDKYFTQMIVQLDLLHKDYLKDFPAIVNSFERECAQRRDFSSIFDNLIIEENGAISPICYGFNSNYSVGTVQGFKETIFEDYLEKNGLQIKNFFSETLKTIENDPENDIVNWNEVLLRMVQKAG